MVACGSNAMIRVRVTGGAVVVEMNASNRNNAITYQFGMVVVVSFIHVQHCWRMQVANRQGKYCNQDQNRPRHARRLTAVPVNCN